MNVLTEFERGEGLFNIYLNSQSASLSGYEFLLKRKQGNPFRYWNIIRFWECPPTPPLGPTLTLTYHLGQNVGLGEG